VRPLIVVVGDEAIDLELKLGDGHHRILLCQEQFQGLMEAFDSWLANRCSSSNAPEQRESKGRVSP